MFWLVLVITTAWRIAVSARLGICYDEGYYHYWSLYPQLSYLDHPPLAAWAMWLSGKIWGDSLWTVRVWPVVTGTAFVLIGRALAGAAFDKTAGNRAGMFLAFVPAFAGNGILMTPDAPFAFCWALTLFATWKALSDGKGISPWWIATGLGAGAGLLSKYNMILFFLGLALLWILSPLQRRTIFWGCWISGLIALVVFLPVVVWNAENHWLSFAFQLRHGFSGKPSSVLKHFSAYAGSLLVLATPLLGLLSLWSSLRGLRSRELGIRFCAVFSIVIVGFFAISALKAHVETNWPMLAFFSGMALLAHDWPNYSRTWKRAAIGVVAACWLVLGIYPLLPADLPLSIAGRSLDIKRMEEFTGGPELASAVRKAKEAQGADFVYVSSHQLLGRISFYAPDLRPFLCPSYSGRIRYPWIDCEKWNGKKAIIVSKTDSNLQMQLTFKTTAPSELVTIPFKKCLQERFYLSLGNEYSATPLLDIDPARAKELLSREPMQ